MVQPVKDLLLGLMIWIQPPKPAWQKERTDSHWPFIHDAVCMHTHTKLINII